jgi:hypothetical protein
VNEVSRQNRRPNRALTDALLQQDPDARGLKVSFIGLDHGDVVGGSGVN